MNKQFHDTCLVCQSKDIQRLNGYEQHDLLKCQNCGFVFMRKIPTETELKEYYSIYAYENEKALSMATRVSIENHLNEFESFRKTNRMLDVGCGEGWILEVAKERGWEVYGTEFSTRAVEICRKKGIRIYAGSLKAEQIPEKDFDVIISTETIEHINNPKEEINNFYQLLRPGGLLYITTPNFNSYLRLIFKARYNIIKYPEHLSYYTRKSLNKLLTDSGFRKIKLRTTGISLSHYQQSKSNEVVNTISGKQEDERIREKIVQSPVLGLLKGMVNRLLTIPGIGMKLKAYYIRK